MYEINVSKNGSHYFATDQWSIGAAEIVYKDFCKRFPKSEGFDIAVIRWENKAQVSTDAFKDAFGSN